MAVNVLRFLSTYPVVSLSTFFKKLYKTNQIACKKCELNSCAGPCAGCCVTLTADTPVGERLSHSIALLEEEKPYLLLERCTQICYAHVQSYDPIKDC